MNNNCFKSIIKFQFYNFFIFILNLSVKLGKSYIGPGTPFFFSKLCFYPLPKVILLNLLLTLVKSGTS
jgi:hypothetical protein